jgi:hypothetical protein
MPSKRPFRLRVGIASSATYEAAVSIAWKFAGTYFGRMRIIVFSFKACPGLSKLQMRRKTLL